MSKEIKKVAPLSPGAIEALEAVKNAGADGITIADMKAAGIPANPSQMTALKNRGLIESVQVEIEVVVTQKRKVQKYFLPGMNGGDAVADEVDSE